MKKQICFYGFAENEGGLGQAGWHYQSLVDVAKRRSDCDVYVIAHSGRCFRLNPHHSEISKDAVLNLNPDFFICRAYFELGKFDKLLERSKFSTYISAALNPPHSFLSRFTKVIGEEIIYKPVPNIKLFKPSPSVQKKYIISAGSFLPRKNQLRIAELIDPGAMDGHTIVFCGKIKSRPYLNKVESTLRSRGIKYLIPNSKTESILSTYGPGYLEHQELAEIYSKSCCFLMMSSSDGNPRALIESILSGVPFIISKTVSINSEYEKFGIRSEFESLNKNLKRMLHEFKMPDITEDFRSKHDIDFFIDKTLEIL
jgi:glycosyltransferase involved in cell wall biosynthesis